MSDRILRVYDVEDEDTPIVLCEECAEWLRDAYQLKVEEKIAGTFTCDVCQHCRKD